MKQLLSGMTDATSPERVVLTRSIKAWEETVAGLQEQQRSFNVSARVPSVQQSIQLEEKWVLGEGKFWLSDSHSGLVSWGNSVWLSTVTQINIKVIDCLLYTSYSSISRIYSCVARMIL